MFRTDGVVIRIKSFAVSSVYGHNNHLNGMASTFVCISVSNKDLDITWLQRYTGVRFRGQSCLVMSCSRVQSSVAQGKPLQDELCIRRNFVRLTRVIGRSQRLETGYLIPDMSTDKEDWDWATGSPRCWESLKGVLGLEYFSIIVIIA